MQIYNKSTISATKEANNKTLTAGLRLSFNGLELNTCMRKCHPFCLTEYRVFNNLRGCTQKESEYCGLYCLYLGCSVGCEYYHWLGMIFFSLQEERRIFCSW